MAEFRALLKQLLETENKVEFKRKFTANRRDTLPYIFEIDTFLRIQNIKDESIAFRKIITSLDAGHRDLFMSDHANEDELTIGQLKDWILERYPPPPMRHEWIIRLKQIRMRKNEDPLIVWQKFLTILEKVDAAINYLNSDLDAASPKRIPNISDDLKHEILCGIFIRNNNEMRCNNVGNINKMTRKYVASKDPTTWNEWKAVFVAMELESLVPRCYQTLPAYQYQTYAFCPDDYNIYLTPKKKKLNLPKDNDHNRKRKREDIIERSQPHKRQRHGTCNKCGKKGHYAYECRSKSDAKGRRDKIHSKLHCRRCKRHNHNETDCRATRYFDGAPIKDDKSDKIREDYKKRNGKYRGRDGGDDRRRRDRYGSRRRGRSTSRSRSRDRFDDVNERSQHKNERSHRRSRGRWGDKDKDEDRTGDKYSRNKPYHRSIAALSRDINEDLDLDAQQAEKIQGYITKIAELTARHS